MKTKYQIGEGFTFRVGNVYYYVENTGDVYRERSVFGFRTFVPVDAENVPYPLKGYVAVRKEREHVER